jgi:hypothetical protein
MKRLSVLAGLLVVFLAVWSVGALPVKTVLPAAPDAALLDLSGALLLAVKTEAATDSLETALSGVAPARLLAGLPDDAARKTFWINCYNAYFQLLAGRDKKQSPALFTEKSIAIAGQRFSLDDIEHGILRRYRWKWSLGYLPQFWPARSIKELAVSAIDCRIHFALNCGAKSCPRIAFYRYDRLEKQLNQATASFLETETEVDTTARTVSVSKIMSWYRGDFGGKSGILTLVGQTLHRDLTGFDLRFREYDWSAQLKNYATL